MGVAFDRGTGSAPTRPALGFRLDQSTRTDVRDWASEHHADCTEEHIWLTRCVNVAPSAFGAFETGSSLDEVTFGFRPNGTLTNVSTFRRKLEINPAKRIVQSQGVRLYDSLGLAHTDRLGTGSVSSELGSSTRISRRYRDYSVDVSAVQLPSGVAVREQYLSARD